MNGKNDLSADFATLDFSELFKTVQGAVMTARIQCERAMGEYQAACFQNTPRLMQNSSKNLAEFSRILALASETLYVLEESQTRKILNVVNRPNKTN